MPIITYSGDGGSINLRFLQAMSVNVVYGTIVSIASRSGFVNAPEAIIGDKDMATLSGRLAKAAKAVVDRLGLIGRDSAGSRQINPNVFLGEEI